LTASLAPVVRWPAVTVLPLLLERLRNDPALVSAPTIITVVDGTGLPFCLSIATCLLTL
jgi:magnesium transporter